MSTMKTARCGCPSSVRAGAARVAEGAEVAFPQRPELACRGEHEPVQIRPYIPADRDAILALAPRLTEGKAPWRDDDAWLAAVRGWVADAADSAGREDNAVFVAVDGDQIVGFVHASRAHPFHRAGRRLRRRAGHRAGQERRGIARALMQAAEDWGADSRTRLPDARDWHGSTTPRGRSTRLLGYLEEDVQAHQTAPGSRRPSGGPTWQHPGKRLSGLHARHAAELLQWHLDAARGEIGADPG